MVDVRTLIANSSLYAQLLVDCYQLYVCIIFGSTAEFHVFKITDSE